MNRRREAITKWSILAGVAALWTGVIVACGNDHPTATPEQEDSADTAEPTKEPPPPPPTKEPPPPPAEPTANAADGGGTGAVAANDEVPDPCGERGQPMCPLQEYMKRTVMPAMKAGRGLDVELAKVAGWAPDPSWNEGEHGWRATAEQGVEAARANDQTKIKATCKACHGAWQKRYRAEFRRRPVPRD